jgi:gliding motility-associated-like protein
MRKSTIQQAFLALVFLFASVNAIAQANKQGLWFDRKKAVEEAQKKGIHYADVDGYVFALEREFYAKLQQPADPNDPYGIFNYKGSTPTTQGAGCPNASFENTNFGGWTGSSGNSNTCGPAGSQSPNYNIVTAGIVSPSGPNAGLTNAANYHTIMTTPATNNLYPNCTAGGYDSCAVKIVGTQTVSEIPVVCPFYPDGKSVRLNGAIANYRAAKLRYNFALGPNNRNITYAFAVVLYGSHAANEQPYFKVSVLDQNNNPIGGTCGVYNINGLQAATDTSFKISAIGWSQVYYRPWRQYGVDLSSPTYSNVTSVNLEFTVGGCCYAGHWGYAYVDAECSQGGTYSSMCAGTNTAVLTAPAGYVAYQWYQLPGNTAVPASQGGNTATVTINPAIVGQVYQIKMTTPTGCTVALNDTIKISGVQIVNMMSSPTCQGGSSGTASCSVIGSNIGYGYTWYNSSNAVVSTNSVATNLPPGVYTVSVTAVSCGAATATVQVNTSPPAFYPLVKNYCGSLAILTASAGVGYTWYQNTTPIPAAAGQQSLQINNPVNNSVYYVTYTTPQGCKDSVRYTLSQIPGGSTYMSNVKSICPTSGPVGYGVVNLSTSQGGPYSYTVSGPGSYYSTLLNTTSKKDSVSGLSIGVYTATVFDGACFYNQTFTVTPYTYNYTVTPTNTVLCINGTVPMTANFGTTVPTACALSTSGGCASPNIITLGTGATSNTQFSWPCVYGNYYKNNRHQMLYTAAELLAAGVQPGKFSSIDWFITSKLPTGNNTSSYIGTLQGFTIKIKCTNVTTLNNTFDNVGLNTVYGPVAYTPVLGWNNHAFSTAYEWDGVSNILVDVCYNINTAIPYTSNPVMPSTNTGVIKCRYAYSDSQPMCGTTNFATTNLNRPNIRFGNCGATNPSNFTYSWTPNYALTSTNTQSTIATPSTSTIYSITVNPIGQVNCAQTQTVNITVAIPVTPTISGGPYCSNFAPVQLTVTPTTGTWSPAPYLTANGIFNPSAASVGANQVVYTTGAGTCVASNTLVVNVEQFNSANITGTIIPKCVTDPTVSLSALVANTTGTWSGTGVSGTTFDPAIAGPGTFNLLYNTQSSPTASLCPDQASLQVAVHTVQQPTISPVGPYCDNFVPVQLSVVPLGGVFSGLNNSATTSSGLFDPKSAIIGGNVVGYTITSGPCVKTTSINVNVEQFIPATLTGGLGPYCWNAPGGNLNSLVVNPGGTWTGPGISGNMFTPLVSGPGDFILTYSTHSNPTAGLCPDASNITIHVNPAPIAPVSASTLNACMPATIMFDVNPNGPGFGVWNFSDGSTEAGVLSTTHVFNTPGTYTVAYDWTDNIGCKLWSQLPGFITIYPLPTANFTAKPDFEVSIADPTIDFENTSPNLNQNTYFWNISGEVGSYDVHTQWTFTKPGSTYVTLIAINQYGCMDTITKIISVKNEYGIWIPNSFTPNGDGLNDEFRASISPYGIDITDFEFDIFDRWGERIFTTKDFMIGWNGGKFNKGEVCKEDVYVYKMRFRTIEKEAVYKTGHVTLIK